MKLVNTLMGSAQYGAFMELWDLTHAEAGPLVGKAWHKKYVRYVERFLPNGESLVVSMGVSHGKQYLTVGFNPSKADLNTRIEIYGYLETLFNYGYAEFINHGRVKRLEVPFDKDGIGLNDVVTFSAKPVKSEHKLEKDGTIYVGGQHANLTLAIYDKAQELAKKLKVPTDLHKIRIEARFKKTGKTIFDAANAENPFAPIVVADRHKLLANKPPLIWEALGVQIENGKSVHAQFAKCSLQKRQTLLAAFEPYFVPWWNPAHVWIDAQKAINKLGPNDFLYGDGIHE